jgi:uncharacterized protein (TIGR02598 family)
MSSVRSTPKAGFAGNRCFSLVEVVVAVGIFAGGAVALIGLFASVARSLRTGADVAAAVDVADAIGAWLRMQPMAAVAARLKSSEEFQRDASGADDHPAADPKVIYASAAGDKIGPGDDPVWKGGDGDKYFEIVLIRNEDLSPAAGDRSSPWLAFALSIRWPAFLPRTRGNPLSADSGPAVAVPVDHAHQQSLISTGSVRLAP